VVRLRSTGTGALDPAVINGSAFKNGAARVRVTYERAESFEIRAELADAGSGPMVSPPVDEKAKARLSAQKAREDAVRARRESRLREERISSRNSRSEPSTVEPPTAAAKRPADPGKTEKPAPSTPKPPPKTAKAPTPAKKTEPVEPPAAESAAAGTRSMRSGILDGITVVEEGNKALVTFATNGMTNYNVTTSAKLSRKWIDIDFPDVAVELPDRIGGGEEIVGEVYVIPSKDDGPGVRVSVEILPTRIGYDVYQEGQSIVLKVSKQ
jgi:hypothetical protein